MGRVGLSALTEGGEEFAQALAQPILQRSIYDPDAEIDLSDAFYQGFVGAAVGGVADGVDTVISSAADAAFLSGFLGEDVTGTYSVTKPQNIEFPTVPIISMSRSDYAYEDGSLPDAGNALRKDAIERAKIRLKLDKNKAAYIPASNIVRNGEEYILKITKDNLHKMLSPAGGGSIPLESIAVMDNLERIAMNGVWKEGKGDRKGRTQIKGYDYLSTVVYIDNEPYVVNMRVRLIQQNANSDLENRLYYYTPEEIVCVEKVNTSSPSVERRALRVNSGEDVFTADKVSQFNSPVNSSVIRTPNSQFSQSIEDAFDQAFMGMDIPSSATNTNLELAQNDLFLASFLAKDLAKNQSQNFLDNILENYESKEGIDDLT